MKSLFLITSLFLSWPCFASIGPLGYVGYDGGDGDPVVSFTAGPSMKAGVGMAIGAGAIADIGEENADHIQIQLTLGTKRAQAHATAQGRATFICWPIEALGFFRFGGMGLRVGGGITHQTGIRVEGTDAASSKSMSFQDSDGIVIEAGWIETFIADVRFTSITYRGSNGQNYDGNTLGVVFGIAFN